MVRKPGSSSTRRIAAPSGTATAEFDVPKSIAQKVRSLMGDRVAQPQAPRKGRDSRAARAVRCGREKPALCCAPPEPTPETAMNLALLRLVALSLLLSSGGAF